MSVALPNWGGQHPIQIQHYPDAHINQRAMHSQRPDAAVGSNDHGLKSHHLHKGLQQGYAQDTAVVISIVVLLSIHQFLML
jgi:hypothetical protein